MSLRAHQHGEQHTSEGAPTNMHTKAFTYTKLGRRLKEGREGRGGDWGAVKRVEATSLPRVGFFFLRGGPKRLRRDLRQLTAVPTTEKKTATFSVVMLSPKKKKTTTTQNIKCKSSSVRKMLISSIPPIPLGVSDQLTREEPAPDALAWGVGSELLGGGEKCEKCQEILAAMSKLQATTVSARSGAPCCSGDRDRPSTTAMETHDLTPLPAVG